MEKHQLETIKFSVKPSSGGDSYGITMINGRIYRNQCSINDEFLGVDGLIFDVFAEMLEKPGDYWPFCCSYCGISGCDSIFVPIRCFHKEDEVILVIRDPLQEECVFCKKHRECDISSPFTCDMAHPVYRAHRFSKEQMRQALESCKAEIEEYKIKNRSIDLEAVRKEKEGESRRNDRRNGFSDSIVFLGTIIFGITVIVTIMCAIVYLIS